MKKIFKNKKGQVGLIKVLKPLGTIAKGAAGIVLGIFGIKLVETGGEVVGAVKGLTTPAVGGIPIILFVILFFMMFMIMRR
tara:strand:+ start:2376 stop:2618 length:243 start_codon:yes stop_codon:yes gene_type:complete